MSSPDARGPAAAGTATAAATASAPRAPLCAADCARLLEVARASIEHGLRHGTPLEVDVSRYPAALRAPGACFVTLRHGHGDAALRGCIGSTEARRPLVADVAHNAFAAANRDPRFAPLRAEERAQIALHLSILGPLEPIAFDSEAGLLAALEPGRDGLWIRRGPHRATFLPQVWEQLPEPRAFLAALLHKAGIPPGTPVREIEAARYRVQEFGGPLAPEAAP